MGKTKFPSDTEIKEMRKRLSTGPASRALSEDASQVDRLKHSLCKEFVVYKNSQEITQKRMAEKIGIDEAVMSKILHYNIDDFTLDRLIKYLSTLHPNIKIKFEVA